MHHARGAQRNPLIQHALARLQRQLPLKARQDLLAPESIQLHQQILYSLAKRGIPPTQGEMSELVGASQLAKALRELGEMDLVVLDKHHTAVLGAYPLTTEITPHCVQIGTHKIFAMCALDAVSVAPIFATEVTISSRCHVSGEPIQIRMRGHDVLSAAPAHLMIGIRWQMPAAVAAHSMCTEMVFLRDLSAGQQWQGDEVDAISLFSLTEAITFGTEFFLPLLEA